MGAEWVGDAADRPLPGNVTSSARWRRISAQQALLLRVARRSAPGPQDAEDAVQEAMLRAAEHPEIDDDRLRAWLVTVTKRLCADRCRQQARETRHRARVAASTLTETTEQQLEDEVCHRAEAAWVAARADELLPARQAQALRLTAAGCDVQQVAGRLGVGPRAAESLLARARRTLRAVLAAGLGLMGWMCRPLATASGSGPVALAAGASCVAVAVTVVLVPAASPPQLGASPPAGPAAAVRQHAGGTTSVVQTPPATFQRTTRQPVPTTSEPAAAPTRTADTTHTPPPAATPRPPTGSPARPAVPLPAAVPGSAADTRWAGPPGSPRPQRPPDAGPPEGLGPATTPRSEPAESKAPAPPPSGLPAQRPSPEPAARSDDKSADPSSDPDAAPRR
ncbi:MAG: sigma-70 family RNA polymerase sigma factor [Pseudonocardiaceae bacterium]|nr:sigma-70 family RNA polymerase sigma factor [Pseudonocardiaceae bacterium]